MFTLAVQKLETSLTELNTAPLITSAIIKLLQQWRKFGNALHCSTQFDQWVTQHAVKQQDKISWYQFLLGPISNTWSDAQQHFIDSLHTV
jgi:hypothetical protein